MKSSNLQILRIIIILHFTFYIFNISAQVIDNKGNRNQSYPVISETKAEIVALINQVEQNRLEASVRYMQQFIRRANTPAALTVQNWLINKFEEYGYEDIAIHYFNYNSQQLDAGNVVVIKQGTEFPDEYIMVTSHYDHPDGPGADDNASGTAGVLECARLLKDVPTKRSIMFVPFNAEELWMVGSLPYAQKCATENMNIIAHLNMDMIGWFPPSNPNLIMASGYSEISKPLFLFYQKVANTYIPTVPTIRLSAGDSYGGDHMPFNMYEYPSLYIGDIEYHSQHPCYHKPCDTIGNGLNRLDLMTLFVKATLAATTELANATLPPQNLSACNGINKISVTWSGDTEFTSYKIYRNNIYIEETLENFYDDLDVVSGEKYEYYVVAIHQDNGEETAPSNKDATFFSEPLELPYSNNFEQDKNGFEKSSWERRNMSGTYSLCNTPTNGIFPDNYLTLAELNWFPIPHNTEDITIRFKWQGTISGIWYNSSMFFEVTNDRKTWHKLAKLSGTEYSWKSYEFSLNEFINSDFFQVRFRLESSGSQSYSYTKIGYIDNVEIDYIETPIDTTISIKENPLYISSFNFFPNPSNDVISISTNNNETPYHLAIYDMNGKEIWRNDRFVDSNLSIGFLPKGNYLLVASTDKHRIARKLSKF